MASASKIKTYRLHTAPYYFCPSTRFDVRVRVCIALHAHGIIIPRPLPWGLGRILPLTRYRKRLVQPESESESIRSLSKGIRQGELDVGGVGDGGGKVSCSAGIVLGFVVDDESGIERRKQTVGITTSRRHQKGQ